jgi:hypothetical protein
VPTNIRSIKRHRKIKLEADSEAAKNGDVTGRYPGPDPLSSEHFSIIHNWLADCLEHPLKHPKCCQSLSGVDSFDAKNVPLPARCIEVFENSIRLIECNGQRGSYITLSHRWTKETEAASTTRANYDARKAGIPIAELPRTFLHAITVAVLLNVKYIWIDSLCIIQDDRRDWETEAVCMADYYQHSLVTLAATLAAELSEDCGLLFQYVHTWWIGELVRMPYRNIKGENRGYFYVHKRVGSVDTTYNRFVRQSALMKRGWIFQEEMLSRRVIHFTGNELFLECATNIAINECGEAVTADRFRGDLHFALKTSLNYTPDQDFNALWYQLVETFSGLALTKPEKDRLLAVAGVAKEHRAAMKLHNSNDQALEYVSGLWLRDIIQGLLWELTDESGACLSKCGAPSWSWASRVGQVKWTEESSSTRVSCEPLAFVMHDVRNPQRESLTFPIGKGPDKTFRLQATNVSGTNPDIFGVSSICAKIQIRGKLVPVLSRHLLKYVDGMADKVAKMTGHSPNFGRAHWRAVCSPKAPELLAGWTSIDHPELQKRLCDTDVEVLALLISTHRESGGFTFGYLSFTHVVMNVLYLQRVKYDIYERVGIGRIFDKDLVKMFDAAQEEIIYIV